MTDLHKLRVQDYLEHAGRSGRSSHVGAQRVRGCTSRHSLAPMRGMRNRMAHGYFDVNLESRVSDARTVMSLRLQLSFGLRREEATKFRPSYADRGDHILLLGSWTKGGLARSIPITTPQQRAVLDEAHELAGSGSLIPAHKRYIEQLRVYEGQCKAAGLSRVHGLRHRYAQKRYEALTGWKAPAAGGPPKRALDESRHVKDAAARQIISRELGHERRAITNVYLPR